MTSEKKTNLFTSPALPGVGIRQGAICLNMPEVYVRWIYTNVMGKVWCPNGNYWKNSFQSMLASTKALCCCHSSSSCVWTQPRQISKHLPHGFMVMMSCLHKKQEELVCSKLFRRWCKCGMTTWIKMACGWTSRGTFKRTWKVSDTEASIKWWQDKNVLCDQRMPNAKVYKIIIVLL